VHVSEGERSIVRERDSERERKRGREEERERGREDERKRGREEERKRGREEERKRGKEEERKRKRGREEERGRAHTRTCTLDIKSPKRTHCFGFSSEAEAHPLRDSRIVSQVLLEPAQTYSMSSLHMDVRAQILPRHIVEYT